MVCAVALRSLYPSIHPYASGILDAGDRKSIHYGVSEHRAQSLQSFCTVVQAERSVLAIGDYSIRRLAGF